MAPILAYWDVRGIANPIRMLLHYADVRFEDKQYELANHAEWLEKDKVALGETLDFPNLPYYIDGLVQISQSKVILAYLGRKHGLDGKSEAELTRMSLIFHEMSDMHYSLGQIAYPPRAASNLQEVHDALRKDYVGSLGGKLARISKFIGSGPWVTGESLTYVDFYVYDILDYNRQLFLPTHVAAFPNLVAYMEMFEGLKGVKEYLASEKFSRLPIYSQFAMFGQNKDYKPTE